MAVDARVKRRRRSLWTVPDLAKYLGVDPSTVHRLEANPVPPLLLRYLSAVGYRLTYHPMRAKERREKGIAIPEGRRKPLPVCTTATETPGTSGLQDEVTDG